MAIHLSKNEREDLKEIVRCQRGEARLHRRARMILLAAEGKSISSIARSVGTIRLHVNQWLKRFEEHRLDGLQDLPRDGRPIEITPLERHQVIATACRSPKELGFQRTLWNYETLVNAVTSSGLVRQISTQTAWRILDDAEIKPHRVKMWCHSKDPLYQQKMRAIVHLYTHLPKGEAVLSIDEKTGMQAFSRSRALKSSEPGQSGRFEFEYKRNGTRCLFACFDVKTGKVLGRCTQKRKRPDFLSFMDWVASVYRKRRVHVVLDNLNTHCNTNQGDFVTEWNKQHKDRFVFYYTPTHGSWLNQVELWFGIVSRRILRYGNFRSPDELIAAIEAFIEEWNKTEAHAFRWTYEGLPLVK
ncbi:MAG: IS630 family transposase [Candidatus Omnitrophica bacterium]|nr:IS630 family transposase [Candidatus Omnitrophota bacterium]